MNLCIAIMNFKKIKPCKRMSLRAMTLCWSRWSPRRMCSFLSGSDVAFRSTCTLFSYYYKNWRALARNSVIKLQSLHFAAWVITVPNLLLKQVYSCLLHCRLQSAPLQLLGWLWSRVWWGRVREATRALTEENSSQVNATWGTSLCYQTFPLTTGA